MTTEQTRQVSAEELFQILGGRRNGSGYQARCPAHPDRTPSLSISDGEQGLCLVHCHAGCAQEQVIAKLAERHNVRPRGRQFGSAGDAPTDDGGEDRPEPTQGDGSTRSRGRNRRPRRNAHPAPNSPDPQYWPPDQPKPNHPTKGQPDEWYEYVAGDGQNVEFYHCRWNAGTSGQKKTFAPVHWQNGEPNWAWPDQVPLYNLDQIVGHPDAPVVVVEGEKAAEAAQDLPGWHVVTTWAGGCNAVKRTDWSPLKGRDVIIWPDADEPGIKAAQSVSEQCRTIQAKSVRIVQLPDYLPEGWDLADERPEHWNNSVIRSRIEIAISPQEFRLEQETGIVSAEKLSTMELPAMRWVIPDLVPEGLTIEGGKPKTGKSFMVLDFSIAVASGTETMGRSVEQGDVLYLALEDTYQSLKERIGNIGEGTPPRLDLVTRWPRLDEGGLELLRDWLKCHPEGRLIVIDTLQKVRKPNKSANYSYQYDYDAITPLKDLAEEFNVAIVVIHHNRKAPADDPLDELSGTTGLSGAADMLLGLRRGTSPGEAFLYGRGRNAPEINLALRFNQDNFRWEVIGDAEAHVQSEARRQILDAFRPNEIMSRREIIEATRLPEGTVGSGLPRLIASGHIIRMRRGQYQLSPLRPGANRTSEERENDRPCDGHDDDRDTDT